MLMDVIQLIIKENKIDHRKLFSDNKSLEITNSPLKINVESMLDAIRSGFVYGAVSYSTYQETLGLSPTQESERADKDWKNGNRERFKPHEIQNKEEIPDKNPITKKQTEKNKEKETKPENMQEATLITCKKCQKQIDYLKQPEAGMGYIKCPECGTSINQEGNFAKVINEPIDPNLETAPYKKDNPPEFLKKYPKGAQEVFIEVFNENLPQGEDYAFPVAYTALKRWMKKHGYKKVNDKWVKEEK
jgi:hypothetical protein